MPTTRPVMAVTAYRDELQRPGWPPSEHVFITGRYVERVEQAGGLALVVAPREDADDAMAGAVLDRVDGLLLTGGSDIDPALFGQPRNPHLGRIEASRDALELPLARLARQLDLPVLGLCRGEQVMAVAAGGSMEQHLPDRTGTRVHDKDPEWFGRHEVQVAAGSRLADIIGAGAHSVPTSHHQAVLDAPGYDIVARHADGTVEAIEDPAARFAIGVQWHPEGDTDLTLFRAFVDAARERSDER